MSVELHRSAYQRAQALIRNGQCVADQRSDWTGHRPNRSAENRFIETYGIAEFGKWHLGEDKTEAVGTKRRYSFPFGDFHNVHRCAVLAAESRAGQYKHSDIELAAAHLHGMLDAVMTQTVSAEKPHVSSA